VNEPLLRRQLAGALTLLSLEQETRRVQTDKELMFLMVNRTQTVMPTDMIFFFPVEHGRIGSLAAVSGISEPDPHAPMVMGLNDCMRHHVPTLHPLIPGEPPSPNECHPQAHGVPPEVMFCPLTTPAEEIVGMLLLARVQPWRREERDLAARLGLCYGHALAALSQHRSPGNQRWHERAKHRFMWAGLALIPLLMALPVRQSVMAPAQIVADAPRLVTAPMDGVVALIHVEPNSKVREGEELLTMEQTFLANRHAMAMEALRVAETEALRAEQLAFSQQEFKTSLPLLRSHIEERTVELEHAKELLERSHVRASTDGLAVFSSAEEWLGQPVRVGQKIMIIADPDKVAVAMDLSIHDAVTLQPGAEFLLFLDTDPLHPRSGQIVHASYEALVTPEGMVAFDLRGKLTDNATPPRIGLRGTARLFGERTSLFFLLFRRPLSALRQFIGV